MESAPLVSFVTPFYNTVEYLPECIESVLRQTYQNWEYVLVDNCSDDGSSEVAQSYVSRFPEKIRLVHTKSFLSQLENYNFALSQITPHSKYCKMVQADDWLFPDCVRSMVEVAEAHPSVGIVSAYQLEGDHLDLDGLPYPSPEVSGRDACRLYFLKSRYLFGTPTSLLLRSSLIRSRNPFYDARYAPFEDGHVCFDLLKNWNLGFVHQVLTFTRVDDQSFVARAKAAGLLYFFRFSALIAHGRHYLSESEYKMCLKRAERAYFLLLAKCALRGGDRQFWELHRDKLASVNYKFDRRQLWKWIPRALMEKAWETFWRKWDSDPRVVENEQR